MRMNRWKKIFDSQPFIWRNSEQAFRRGYPLGQLAMIASAEAAARDCYEKGPPTLRGLLWALRSADIPLVQSGRMFSLTGTPLSMLWSWGCTLGSTAYALAVLLFGEGSSGRC